MHPLASPLAIYCGQFPKKSNIELSGFHLFVE